MIEETETTPPAEDTPAAEPAPQMARSEADWQSRVREEHDALESKYSQLLRFIRDKAHAVEQRELQLLKDQAEAMHCYLLVLKARIASWF